MAFDDDQILQDYIARLLTVQDTRDALLDESDLQAAAHDLGLSERDLARADAIAEAHRQRGKNFARHDAWDEAIAEFRQAMVLDPFDVPLLHELAVAHASRYEETHDPEDRTAAYTYAQRCTQLDPNHAPSFALISALNKTAPGTLAERSRSRVLALTIAAMLILVGAGVAIFMLADVSAPVETPIVPNVPTAPPPAAAPALPYTDPVQDQQVPVRFVTEDEGLQLDVQRSLVNDYDSSFAYKLHATLLNQQAELHRLRMRLDLLDAQSNVLLSQPIDVRSDYQPPLRPGDTAPVGKLVFEKQSLPAIASARLSVMTIEREPAAPTYEEVAQIPLVWDVSRAALDITFHERENSLRPNFDRYLHFLTFAVHNNGPRTVKRLYLKVRWFTAENREITSKTTYAVPPSGPALQAGATWVVRVIETLPYADVERYDHYTVHVIDAE